MHKIFHPAPLEGTLTLSEEESKHAIKVMRFNVGDHVQLLDGKGSKAVAEISLANQKRTEVEIIKVDKIAERSSSKLTIAIAPTKNINRIEWFIEKCTEIGIDRIALILCHQSERKIVKTERLRKIMISAMKQSGQLFLPELSELTEVKSWISNNKNGFIAHCEDIHKTERLSSLMKPNQDLTILIGPEGDFTPSEVNFALENDFKPISLGSSILRTETAGVVACTIANN